MERRASSEKWEKKGQKESRYARTGAATISIGGQVNNLLILAHRRGSFYTARFVARQRSTGAYT
jgi:hypothetical protein